MEQINVADAMNPSGTGNLLADAAQVRPTVAVGQSHPIDFIGQTNSAISTVQMHPAEPIITGNELWRMRPTAVSTQPTTSMQIKPPAANGSELSFGNLFLPPMVTATNLVELAKQRPLHCWQKLFTEAEADLNYISSKLIGNKFYPLMHDIFRAFELTPLATVKVVIIGQDPYPGMGAKLGLPNAMGLSFSVRQGETIPPSLKNIFTELATDIPGFTVPTHGDLTYWAAQGVLLLNKALTVIPNKPDDLNVMTYWMGFLRRTLKLIQNERPNTIFVLWGNSAKSLLKDAIFRKKYIIEGVHPSPLSANKGFFGGKYFSRINEMLLIQKEQPIDWQI